MNNIDQFLFSKNERVLLGHLNRSGERPRNLMRKTKISHASLYLAFRKLVIRKLANRFVRNGKIFWKKTGNIDADTRRESGTKVFVHTDKEFVKKSVLQVLKLTNGDRMTIVEGTQSDSGWFDLFSKKETIEFNNALSSRKIICESILPESYFKDAIPRLGKDWASSYRARPIVTYIVKKNLISSNALLIALRNRIIILYAKDTLAVEIQNDEIVSLIQGMLEVVKSSARKVNIDNNFNFGEAHL